MPEVIELREDMADPGRTDDDAVVALDDAVDRNDVDDTADMADVAEPLRSRWAEVPCSRCACGWKADCAWDSLGRCRVCGRSSRLVAEDDCEVSWAVEVVEAEAEAEAEVAEAEVARLCVVCECVCEADEMEDCECEKVDCKMDCELPALRIGDGL